MKRTPVFVTLLSAACLMSAAGTALAMSGAGAIALEFPVGARFNGMGEAGTALAQDATAMWWNPGGLAFANDVSPGRLEFMQSKLVPDLADDIALYWGGYAARKWGGSFGFNMTYLSMGDQEGTNDNGESTGIFSSNMWAMGFTYGTRISTNLGAGLGVKYFRDNLAPDGSLQDGRGGSGSTFAVDAGLLWKVPALKANFGVALANLGPNITHVDEDQSDPLPRKVTFGAAYGLVQGEALSLLLVADYLVPLLNWNDDNDDYGLGLDFGENEWGAGTELAYAQSLYLRFGFKKGTGEIEDTTWGFGLDLGRWVGKKITFGYASVPQAKGLDHVNRISLGYDF